MDFKKKKETSRALAVTIVILVSMVILSLIAVIMLINTNRGLTAQIVENKQTIVIPMVNNVNDQEFSFYGERGDARYLKLMALSFLSLRLDVTTQNVEYSHEILTSYLTDELKQKLVPILFQEKRRLAIDSGSSSFFVRKIQVSPSNGIVEVEGDLKFYYGIKDTKPIPKRYQLRIETRRSNLILTDFVEILE
ncbi:TraE/TraK family type IV conjugative transfer system protein [Pasteurella multocida]|uniref:TraE/TraK family type IV conjugative transfer system protein n=1 Tax=Pasteurella multocida TaxID=747 RepID=UPI00147BB99D|nr:TraE/TraK family type IV conjugative transfer system protein [Pasteurella multocida]NNH97769.1 hypothetical protein [Pasteurella multocida]NNI42888.1 hypothetical protein [Pasteurella multocida]